MFDSVKAWWQRATCDHWTTHEGPTLHFDEQGNPYVRTKTYCKDCGKGMPNFWYQEEMPMVQALLDKGHRMKIASRETANDR